MEIIQLLLTGKDQNYCRALSRSISLLSRDMLITFSGGEMAQNLVKGKYELCIFEGEPFENVHEDLRGVVLLVENKEEERSDLEKSLFYIYKYKNVKEIIKEILLAYNLFTGKRVMTLNDNNCRMVSVYSGAGGLGKTSIAIGLAQEFSRFRQKKVLYINYEEWDNTGEYFGFEKEDQPNSVSDYLYYLSRGKQVNLESFLVVDEFGICFFKPVTGRNLLKNLNKEDLCNFFNQIIGAESIDYVIIDCNNCLDENTLWLLKNANHVVYLSDDGFPVKARNSSNKDEFVIRFLEEKINDISQRIIKVSNMNEDYESRQDGNGTIYVQRDPASFHFENGRIKISVERGFGQGIRAIADQVEKH